MTTHDPRIRAMRWCHHYGRAHLWLGQATACGRVPRNLGQSGAPYCTVCLAYAHGWTGAPGHGPAGPGHPDPGTARPESGADR